MWARLLSGVGRVFIVTGLVLLGFVAYQLWGTGLEEAREQGQLSEQFADELAGDEVGDGGGTDAAADPGDPSEVAASLASVNPRTAPPMAPPPEGEPLGIIEIPRIDLARVVVSGTSRSDLKKGPGHYLGTPLPGQPGNAGIAGHRTTYGAPFNRIDELVPGDEVIVSTPQGRFTYEVVPAPGSDSQAWYTVKPSQVEVLADMGDDRVTLTACHPKYSARERIIVHAVLAGPAAAAAPAEPDSPTVRPEDGSASAEAAAGFDEGLGSDPDELPPALLFGALAAAVAGLAWYLSSRTERRWLVWVVATPVFCVLVWNGYVHMDRYLPAI